MITERPVAPELKALLVNNEPFLYAHLVKFERPDGSFAYITNASRNVTWNGNTYLANKLLNVGSISETVKAAPSNTSIVLDGNAVGATIAETVSISSVNSLFNITFPSYVDLSVQGFREGDKINITRSGVVYTGTINSFPSMNVMRVSSSNLVALSNMPVEITLTSEEIVSILLDKTDTTYSSFINRRVDIYKAYFANDSNSAVTLIGDPIYIFKGIINNVAFEDSEDAVRVTWGVTNQWGDFSQVKGRVTSDSFHRALDSSGIPQPSSAIRPEYATDKGFQHSESSINMLTKYVVQVEKQKIKTKKFLGIVTGVKVTKYYEPENRYADLNFNTQAKSIPVIYGVRVTEGIPVFADTLADDSGKVYVAYALSEGEIGGIYDLYVEGQSLICLDEADSDARDEDKVAARNDDSVETLCRGRADRGDVLTGEVATGTEGSEYYDVYFPDGFMYSFLGNFRPPSASATIYSKDSGGLGHDETLEITSPQNLKLLFYTGKADQEACPLLKTLASNNQFKIQTTYAESAQDYWTDNHRLLDTAYVVAEIKIAEGETTVPSIEYIVRGKFIDCYNYDQSYAAASSNTGNASAFKVGDTVTFSTGSTAMIIDKFRLKGPDGVDDWRFRWDSPPNVNSSSTFSMTANGSTWTMGGYNVASDRRVSINPVMQMLDYVTSARYGKNLSLSTDIDLPSWSEAARKCDKRSDVTVQLESQVTIGQTYSYSYSGRLVFRGLVSEIKNGNYTTFTNVVGKLTNKWNSWKSWKAGDIIYVDNSLYLVTQAGVISTKPTGATSSLTPISSITLTRTGGGSVSTVANSGNPVRDIRNGQIISGYSLYDCDSIDYWRACGWEEHDQRYVTKYQTNLIIDTANTLYDNINGFLEHFNGILRYTSGKYYLDVEEVEPVIPAGDIRNITQDDIVGKIQLNDEGIRSSFNSLVAAFADPAIKFEARNIGFFNSDYLAADKNVPKKGNISVPGITNYYNTRLLAESYLNKSRFGLTINVTLRYSGILLLPGTVIELTYARYKWNNKPFRIESMNIQPDGLVDIVAKEYDESFYLENRINRSEDIGGTGPVTRIVSVGPPSNLIVTSAETEDDLLDGVELFWSNNARAVPGATLTELFGSRSPELFLVISSITSGSVLNCSEAKHYLVPGMPIYPEDTYNNELLSTKVYYVKDVLSDNQFTLTENKQQNNLVSLTPNSTTNFRVRTATLLASVPVPGNSYFDNVPAEGTDKVEKYYWVRHKVIE